MTDTKISDFSVATSIAVTDLHPLNQSSNTLKSTLTNSAEAFVAAPSSLWSLRASSTANSSNATSVTINKPTGTVDGDLMVFIATTRNTTVGDPSGGAAVTELYDVDTGSNERAAVWYKIAASESASYTLATSTGATARIAVVCFSFTGVDTLVSWGSRHGSDSTTSFVPSCNSVPGGLTIYAVHNCYTDTGAATWLSPTLSSAAVSSNDGSDTTTYATYRMSRGYQSGAACIMDLSVSSGDYMQASVVTFE